MKKYHNEESVYKGVVYASKKEAHRAWELDMMERAGVIEYLRRQVPFVLQEGYFNNRGKKIRPIVYVADFTYFDKGRNNWVVEDTKGFRTEVYKIKKKMFEARFSNWLFDEI